MASTTTATGPSTTALRSRVTPTKTTIATQRSPPRASSAPIPLAGFVAPAASPGLDCAAADSFAYVVVSTRADADRDTACSGLPVTQCIGAFLPFGQRKTFDCNPTDDCNDTNANVFRLMSTRADGDADTYCAGASDSTCVGASAPAGRRFAFACSGDDCNDSSSAVFRWLSVRADADNDGYCIGSTFSQCSGTFPGAGKRLPSGCQAIDDCKDSNANATVSCFLAGAYQTTSAIKQCGVGFSFSENRTVTGGVPPCPVGFSRINAASLLNYTGNPGGACVVTGDTTLTMSCPSLTFGTFQCSIQADCTAN